MVTLAKALGGGLPTGAIGGTEEVMAVVEDGTVYQVGTYNGNPLGMAAARANLLEVLTPEAYAHLDALNDRIVAGCEGVIEQVRAARLRGRHRLEGLRHVLDRRRSSTTRRSRPTRTPRSSELAWLFNMNRGIFMTPGREEEWTLSVTHTDEAVDAYVAGVRRDGRRADGLSDRPRRRRQCLSRRRERAEQQRERAVPGTLARRGLGAGVDRQAPLGQRDRQAGGHELRGRAGGNEPAARSIQPYGESGGLVITRARSSAISGDSARRRPATEGLAPVERTSCPPRMR